MDSLGQTLTLPTLSYRCHDDMSNFNLVAVSKLKGKKKSKGVKKGVGAGAKGKAKLTKGVKKLTIAKAAAKKK